MRPHRAVFVPLCFLTVVTLGACSGVPPDGGAGGNRANGAPDAGTSAAAPSDTSAQRPEVLIAAPDLAGIELRDQHDAPVLFEGLRGKPALMSFIYTRCPMPEMCPATMLRFQEVQNALSEEQRAGIRLITVSFDPEYDTPEVLAEYAELWDVDGSFWSVLTGTESDIHRIASSYGLWYEQTEDGNFDHAMYSMILLPDGSLHRILTGTAWDAEETAAALLALNAADSTPR